LLVIGCSYLVSLSLGERGVSVQQQKTTVQWTVVGQW
jgi:hypothetical protein